MGKTETERQAAYRALFKAHIEHETLNDIRRAANHDVPLGDIRFKEEVETMLGRRIQDNNRGRPRKETLDEQTI